mgnify:CR=1 FL=1
MPLSQIPLLQADNLAFPDIATAQRERDGLVAVGGDLSTARMLAAYRQGIFPWYDEYHPIIWWAFAERMVLYPASLNISRSLHKSLRNRAYCVSVNHAFQHVVRRCARAYRHGQQGTWITAEMQAAYRALYQIGHAHSFEYWYPSEAGGWHLGGGLYGVQIGQVFFGESMFADVSDASKIAFVHAVGYLQQRGVKLIDCQMHTDHLARFGGKLIPYDDFRQQLYAYCPQMLTLSIEPTIIANTCPQYPPPF